MDKGMKIVTKDIDDLIMAEYNPRQLSETQFQQLSDSIKRFGLVDPIIINSNPERQNVIIGGHQRVYVARRLNIFEIPCVELNLDLEKEKELNIRLNKNTGGWDFDILGNLFELDDLVDWGFEDEELGLFDEPSYDELIAEDKEKPLQIQIKVKDEKEFENCVLDVEELLKKYDNATFSVSGGEV